MDITTITMKCNHDPYDICDICAPELLERSKEDSMSWTASFVKAVPKHQAAAAISALTTGSQIEGPAMDQCDLQRRNSMARKIKAGDYKPDLTELRESTFQLLFWTVLPAILGGWVGGWVLGWVLHSWGVM